MSAAAKKIVRSFLESDMFINPDLFKDFIHPDFRTHWHASSGYREYDYNEYYRLTESTASSYESMRTEITHMISEKDEVAARFTVFVKTVENPREEIPIGYFISIFKVSENKIIEIHQTSHPSEK